MDIYEVEDGFCKASAYLNCDNASERISIVRYCVTWLGLAKSRKHSSNTLRFYSSGTSLIPRSLAKS